MAAAVTEVIQDDLYLSEQSWNLVRIVSVSADPMRPMTVMRRVRVRIRRNAYDFQSYGVAENWTAAGEWAEVVRRPIEALQVGAKRDNGRGTQVDAVSYVHSTLSPDQVERFEADFDSLLAKTLAVIS